MKLLIRFEVFVLFLGWVLGLFTGIVPLVYWLITGRNYVSAPDLIRNML